MGSDADVIRATLQNITPGALTTDSPALRALDALERDLEHAKATIGLAITYISAARFSDFVNRRAAMDAASRAEEPT